MFQVLDVSSDLNSRNIIRNKAEINTHKYSSNGALYVLLYILFNFCPSLFSLFLCCCCFFGILWLFLFIFFDIFSPLRSTKEVTIENMSLNKWKAWPMKILEDVLKIDKKLVTTKRWCCDQFLSKIKIFKPDKARDGRIRNFFWSILIYGTSKSKFVCEN